MTGKFTMPNFVAWGFFVLPFTYMLQVLTMNEKVGVLPFALIALGIFVARDTHGQNIFSALARCRIEDPIERFVVMLVLFSVGHILVSLVRGDVSIGEALRFFIIYVGSSAVFFYASRVSNESADRSIAWAVIAAASLIALHWIYDTYVKMILREPGEFARMSFEYIKYRNGFGDNQVNVSLLRPEYRSYGLLDKHTTTGAVVALGGFAALAMTLSRKHEIRFAVLTAFFLALTSGMATTAWLSFVLIAPTVFFLPDAWKDKQMAKKIMYWSFSTLAVVALLCISTKVGRDAFGVIANLFRVQAELVLGNYQPGVSYLQIYQADLSAYIDYHRINPGYFLTGEGYGGYGDTRFMRGGDCAFFELLVTFGVTFSIYLGVTLALSIKRALTVALDGKSNAEAKAFLLAAVAFLAFMILSLVHYNTFFNKSIFVFLYLALGWIRKYAPRTTNAERQAAPVNAPT